MPQMVRFVLCWKGLAACESASLHLAQIALLRIALLCAMCRSILHLAVLKLAMLQTWTCVSISTSYAVCLPCKLVSTPSIVTHDMHVCTASFCSTWFSALWPSLFLYSCRLSFFILSYYVLTFVVKF